MAAAIALLRSALEKTLQTNGYARGTLPAKIDEAAADGVITAARSQKAHEDIRVLGNEVVHDEWRAVTEDEGQSALHYTQRVLEDLCDDRDPVERILIGKGRIQRSRRRIHNTIHCRITDALSGRRHQRCVEIEEASFPLKRAVSCFTECILTRKSLPR